MTDIFTIERETITTRRQAEAIAESAVSERYDLIDFSTVEFVSRAVADEFINQTAMHDITLCGKSGDVNRMFETVMDRTSTDDEH